MSEYVKKLADGRRCFFVPQLNTWVHAKTIMRCLKQNNIDAKQYYDMYVWPDAPKECPVCHKQKQFISVIHGYGHSTYCSSTCCNIARWNDPVYKAKMLEINKQPITKQRKSDAVRKKNIAQWSTEDGRRRCMQRLFSDDVRARRSKSVALSHAQDRHYHMTSPSNCVQGWLDVNYCTHATKVYYYSRLEYYTLMFLESQHIQYAKEHIVIPYIAPDNKQRHYIVDLQIFLDNVTMLVEVKPAKHLTNDWVIAKARAAMQYAKAHNMLYDFLTNLEVFDTNILTTRVQQWNMLICHHSINVM